MLSGHGIARSLRLEMDHVAREFFTLPTAQKAAIAMAKSGRAWRGWFPLEGELTSGVADLKEGFYVGRDLPATHPSVVIR